MEAVQATAALKFENIKIESNGTKEGTTIVVNGKAIKNLASLGFHFWNDMLGCPISIHWSTVEPDVKPGDVTQYTTYSLCPPKAEASLLGTTSPEPDVSGANLCIAEVPNVFPEVTPRTFSKTRQELYRNM